MDSSQLFSNFGNLLFNGRKWVLAIIFAITDRVSHVCLGLIIAIVVSGAIL